MLVCQITPVERRSACRSCHCAFVVRHAAERSAVRHGGTALRSAACLTTNHGPQRLWCPSLPIGDPSDEVSRPGHQRLGRLAQGPPRAPRRRYLWMTVLGSGPAARRPSVAGHRRDARPLKLPTFSQRGNCCLRIPGVDSESTQDRRSLRVRDPGQEERVIP